MGMKLFLTPAHVRRSRAACERRIAKAQGELARLQEDCEHIHTKMEHKSNTGNYDPTQDRYWKDFECEDCGKKWTEESR